MTQKMGPRKQEHMKLDYKVTSLSPEITVPHPISPLLILTTSTYIGMFPWYQPSLLVASLINRSGHVKGA